MSDSALQDIQQSLNAIRDAVSKENAKTQMAALQLLLGASESIVQLARKMDDGEGKAKTKMQKIAIPQTKVVKQKATASNDTDDTERTRSNDNLSPTKPQPPLTPQQQREQ